MQNNTAKFRPKPPWTLFAPITVLLKHLVMLSVLPNRTLTHFFMVLQDFIWNLWKNGVRTVRCCGKPGLYSCFTSPNGHFIAVSPIWFLLSTYPRQTLCACTTAESYSVFWKTRIKFFFYARKICTIESFSRDDKALRSLSYFLLPLQHHNPLRISLYTDLFPLQILQWPTEIFLSHALRFSNAIHAPKTSPVNAVHLIHLCQKL